MKNKNVGFLIIGIAIIMIVIVLVFNYGLRSIVSQTCSHGSECSMYDTIAIQTWVSLSIAGLILVIGIFLIFSKPDEVVLIKKIRDKKKKLNLSGLDRDEKKTIEFLQKEGGGVFQRDLMEKLETGKVKITRLLDRLESKGLIERKRRGMNNIVILKR